MASGFEVDGNKTTVYFRYTADTEIVQEIVEAAGENLYNRGVGREYQVVDGEEVLIPWDDLTNPQN